MTYSDFLYSKAAARGVPISGGFELSPLCNFACKMCYVRHTSGQLAAEGKRLRTVDEWLSLAASCKEAGMLFLLLSGGEPFLYPGFRELYEQLHDMGLLLSVNTNGSFIDGRAVEWLKKRMPSRINITLYGSSADTYGKVCGNPDGYRRTVQAVELLREAGIPVVINASMIPENNRDLEAIIEFGVSRGINTRVSPYMFPPVRRTPEQTDSRSTPAEAADMMLRKTKALLNEEDCRRHLKTVLERAGQIPEPSDGSSWGESFEEDHMRCRAGRCSFWVSWEGNMTACAMMQFPKTVKPFETPFADCWRQIREAVAAAPVLSGCALCSKKHICKPCAAMLLSETGSVNEKAPYLCEMADCALEMIRNIPEK